MSLPTSGVSAMAVDAELHKLTQVTGPAEVISQAFPWFFEMRGLVSERPNVVLVGIGNGTSSIDMSTYLNPVTNSTDYEGVNSVGVSDEECGADATSEGQDITEPDGDDGDDGDAEIHIPAKRKATGTSPHVQKANAHTGGTPAVKQEPKKTRITMMDKFSDIAKAQEDTAQRAIVRGAEAMNDLEAFEASKGQSGDGRSYNLELD